MPLAGIIPPLVTPMLADESLDLPGLRAHIDFLLGHKVHGIFVLGTTGEFYALDDGEKQAVIAEAVSHCQGRSPVYAGTGAETTREVVRLTKLAEREGVAGVSVITPYFLKPTQAEMVAHFRAVAESVTIPVILYNNPATCAGVNLEPDTVAKLAEVPNIIGIKDSSGDMQQMLELFKVTDPATFAVLNGRDTLIRAALTFGAAGAIPACSNIAPDLCVGLYDAVKSGDAAAAEKFQARIALLRMAFPLATGNGAAKEAMALLGRPAGPCRAPIGPMSVANREKLKGVLKAAGLP